MKLVRFLKDRVEVCGRVDGDDVYLQDASANGLVDSGEKMKWDDIESFLPPVNPGNIYAVGKNYSEHCKETQLEEELENPVIFIKTTNTVTAHNEKILIPIFNSDEVDYEAELAVIIGKTGKNIPKEKALEYVLGYTCAQDISARDAQFSNGGQWVRGKSFDTFCPLGPVVETELDPTDLRITQRLNGKVMQDDTTASMLFSVAEIISYVSRGTTLLPGTVILTGTPGGVGFTRDPAVFLKDGDKIEVEIENIGKLQNVVEGFAEVNV
ncbi:MAG: fumarylacetoacetate hydrolase family protein [Kiritimatiellae bacterium]|jgi:2-keto-4-pentenoate hydratase/2-oxohepta-3-ene-1,7-dioic acid hydratase in catechol pathway|nr:fumarylacetoacetate hydrolase family protein [Kiritimatiellia bacterium]